MCAGLQTPKGQSVTVTGLQDSFGRQNNRDNCRLVNQDADKVDKFFLRMSIYRTNEFNNGSVFQR